MCGHGTLCIDVNEPNHPSFTHQLPFSLSIVVWSLSPLCHWLHLFVSLVWPRCHVTNPHTHLHAHMYSAPHPWLFTFTFSLQPIQPFSLHLDVTYAMSPRTFAHYPRAETHTHLFEFDLVVIHLPHHQSHSLMLSSTLSHNRSCHPCGYITNRTHLPMCTHFPIITKLTFACLHLHTHIWCSHSTSLTSFVYDVCMEAHVFARCSSKYFSLLCHMFEGLGDFIRAILLALDGAPTVVSFYLILFILPLYPFSFITYCGSCHATGGTFRLWSASPANILLLIALIFWSVKMCHWHYPESLVAKADTKI